MNNVIPGKTWETWSSPSAAGYSQQDVERFCQKLTELPTTSFVVTTGGKVVFSYGDTSRASYLASCRKSILSLLFGKYVCEGKVDLNQTIGEIGIDEVDGLTDVEKSATVHQVLISSSGVFYPPGSPGSDLQGFPNRGDHGAGYFHYSNWDFNVAGEIFRRLTGVEVHDALQSDLAEPLGFEDFDRSRQKMLKFPTGSQYPAYHMFLSGRDMARVGLMVARGGKWGEKQVIPKEWIEKSTSSIVMPDQMNGKFKNGDLGYGYYWWTPLRPNDPRWEESFLALGHFGQMILGLPTIDTVIVHRRSVSDQRVINRHHHGDTSEPPAIKAKEFLHLAAEVLSMRNDEAAHNRKESVA
jgi:CubicO group peptidase (beta-lactamase class C family)